MPDFLTVPSVDLIQELAQPAILVTGKETVVLLEAARQGPPGTPGPPGQGGVSYVTFRAAGAIGGHRAVRSMFAQRAQYADHNDVPSASSVLGITLHAAEDGDQINVAASGEITEPSWAWVIDAPIFVGVAGVLTQTPPPTGFLLVVGVATSPTSMLVSVKQPIIL